MSECDQCQERSGVIEVRVQRPSDPQDMCCIMLVCEVCNGGSGSTVAELNEVLPSAAYCAALPEVWQEWIQQQDHYLWLS